jgi:hypothetical protein
MNSQKIAEIFNINYPFTQSSLDSAFQNKIRLIKNNEQLSVSDKDILISNYIKKYNYGNLYLQNKNRFLNITNSQDDFFSNHKKMVDNFLSSSIRFPEITNDKETKYQSYSYISNNVNGNNVILESKTKSINGKTDTIKNAYMIDSNGSKKVLDYDKIIDKYNKSKKYLHP